MSFTYAVNVYSDMALSKGHLGSRGGGGEHLKINTISHWFLAYGSVAIK